MKFHGKRGKRIHMCNICNKEFVTLIESERLETSIIGWNKEMKATELEYLDNSVVFEIRNGQGYIRLGNRDDMQCLDHGEYIKINHCPMCGRKLK